jgi:hypothetical protein
MDKIQVDYSGLKQWRDCQLAYFFGYELQIQSKGSVNPESPLIYGSIGHDALQSWYDPSTFHDNQTAIVAAAKSWSNYKSRDLFRTEHAAGWVKLWTQLSENLTAYFEFYQEEAVNPLSPEQPFSVDLTPSVNIYGKMDSLIEYKGVHDTEKKIWILENKFYKTLPSDIEYLDWDLQSSTYSIVGRTQFGSRYGGILYNFIRKTQAKDLTISRFQRVEVVRPKNQLKAVIKFVVAQALQMKTIQEKGTAFIVPKLDNSPMWDNSCKRCTFNRDICKAFRDGEDWEAVMNDKYEKRHAYAIADEDVNLE